MVELKAGRIFYVWKKYLTMKSCRTIDQAALENTDEYPSRPRAMLLPCSNITSLISSLVISFTKFSRASAGRTYCNETSTTAFEILR